MRKSSLLLLSLLFIAFACKDDSDRFDPFAEFSVEMTAYTDSSITYRFINQSEYAERFRWNFGDHLVSEEENPTHQYTKEGEYTIILMAYNEINEKDTAVKTIAVDFQKLPPLALFSYEKISIDTHSVSVQFTNLSEHALTYKWEFGDTTCSEQKDPLHVYNYEGTYSVKLKAFNADHDADSTTRQVEISFAGN